MWFVKDEFSSKVYFMSSNLITCQKFANYYNETHKLPCQRMFKFNLYSFTSVSIFNSHEHIIDVNGHTLSWSIFQKPNYLYKHPFAIKDFDKKHKKYLEKKLTKIKCLCKKYHVWSYNASGRKCDGFDF